MWEIINPEYLDERIPLDENNFELLVGRDDILRRIKRYGRENTILYGPQGIGKTSILNWFMYFVRTHPEIGVPIKVVGIPTSWKEFLIEIIGSISNYALKSPNTSERAKKRAETYINEIKKKERMIAATLLYRAESLAELLTEEYGSRLFFFIDEGDVFLRADVLRTNLKGVMVEGKYNRLWTFIVTMSSRTYKNLRESDTGFLDRFQEKIQISYMNDADALEMIERRLNLTIRPRPNRGYYPFTEEALTYIIQESANVPRYIIKNVRICLTEAKDLGRSTITTEFARKIIEAEGTSAAYTILEGLGETAIRIYTIILENEERGVKAPEILKELNMSISRQAVYKWLRRLEKEGFIRSERIGKNGKHVKYYPEEFVIPEIEKRRKSFKRIDDFIGE